MDVEELRNEGLCRDFSWFGIWFSCGKEAWGFPEKLADR
jgi:hypothetical protein